MVDVRTAAAVCQEIQPSFTRTGHWLGVWSLAVNAQNPQLPSLRK